MTKARTTDAFLLLCSIILIAAALTWVVPAGHYERARDAQTGATQVVPGSFRSSPAHPVGPWGVLLSIPKGLIAAADIVFFVLMGGAALTVIEITGAMGGMLDWLAVRFASRPLLILPLVSSVFVFGGASYGMYEEILAFVPLLCALMRRLRMTGTMAVAVSMGSAAVAAAFSPFNTFHLGISQPLAEVPLFSGAAFRSVFFVIAMAAWLAYIMWRASQMRHAAPVDDAIPRDTALQDARPATSDASSPSTMARHVVVLAMLGGGLATMIAGAMLWDWTIVHFTAVLIAVGVLAGLAGGLKLRGTSHAIQEGLRRLAYAAVLVGVARAISVVLEQGAILDTITNALFRPLRGMPPGGTGIMMFVSQSLLAVPIPSDSGRAMLALPILVPLSDLLHVSRQVVVLTYQYSVLVSGLLTPTMGAMLAMLTVAEVPLATWWRFVLPIFLVLAAISGIAIVVAIRVGLQ
jgi:uncharacterized ion transporter superfamily protein YfcC